MYCETLHPRISVHMHTLLALLQLVFTNTTVAMEALCTIAL